jgi:hypothetical protein
MAFSLSSLNPFATPATATAPTAPAPTPQPKANQSATLPNNANLDQKPIDPLAPFAKMYDTATEATQPPQFVLDDKLLSTAASSLNFMTGADPALMQRAEQGDSKAIIQLMEHASRTAYQHALSHSSTLTGKFTDAREAFNSKEFSGKVKNELTVNALTGTANFDHPVVRKELVKVAGEMQRQHPDASPQEVANMAKDYITQLSRAVNPDNTSNQQKTQSKATDWDSFFDSEVA